MESELMDKECPMFLRSLRTAWSTIFCLAAIGWGDGPIQWRTDYDHALGEAKATGKLLLVNIHATWCIPCKKLNATTLVDPALGEEIMASCVPLSLDADQDAGVIRQWPITGFPTQLFLTPDGQIINTIVGNVPVATYQATLRKSLESMANARPRSTPATLASMPKSSPAPSAPAMAAVPAPPSATFNAQSRMEVTPPVANGGYVQQSPTTVSPSGMPTPSPLGGSVKPGTLANSSITSVLPSPAPFAGNAPPAAPPMPPAGPAAIHPSGPVPPPPAYAAATQNLPARQEIRSTPMMVAGSGEIRACDASVPLALDGFCPVSMFKRSELIRGADDQCCVYKDKRYQFISAADREAFIQNPKKFLPSEDGFCVVTWAETHQRSQGNIQFPALFGDYLFLFANDDARQRFLEDPERYVDPTGRAHRIPLHSFRGDRSTVR
jgi:YHS domain-containing protein/thiol-disulfide isomerase/thioredoxin